MSEDKTADGPTENGPTHLVFARADEHLAILHQGVHRGTRLKQNLDSEQATRLGKRRDEIRKYETRYKREK
ncbi:hypothetical protein E2C01_030005 [Portunus trituberculatus]|uniref:Uncharacterized protein n=1 Tax=Portunus trituberculatus TaxID=210409 RepID=A0A5B7EUH7_PORTR|nr:hypothetical protein [Portunus trituberculatus]